MSGKQSTVEDDCLLLFAKWVKGQSIPNFCPEVVCLRQDLLRTRRNQSFQPTLVFNGALLEQHLFFPLLAGTQHTEYRQHDEHN